MSRLPIDSPHITVVGAGIAGLAAARETLRLAPEARVTLLEKSGRVGGKLRTNRAKGFLMEAGADSFLASKPQAIELCREVGIAQDLVTTLPENRRSYVMHEGTLHRIPEGLTGLVPAQLEPLITSDLFSEHGKRRLLREPEIPASTSEGDETLADFMGRRFGNEVYERLIEPLMAGIYAGDGADLSLAATFPQLREMERTFGSVVRAAEAGRAAARANSPSGFLAPANGMEALAAAVGESLRQGVISLDAGVHEMTRRGDGYRVHMENGATLDTDAVILAVPSWAAAEVLSTSFAHLASLLGAIGYSSTATICLGYRAQDVREPIDGYGYIVPRREGRPVLACTWVSNKFSGRAPDGYVLARLFVGRAGADDVASADDTSLMHIAREELREVAGIQHAPIVSRVFRWPHAMPQYTPGHMQRLDKIAGALDELPGLSVAGHAYRGVGVPDCIRSGREAAARVVRAVAPHSHVRARRA